MVLLLGLPAAHCFCSSFQAKKVIYCTETPTLGASLLRHEVCRTNQPNRIESNRAQPSHPHPRKVDSVLEATHLVAGGSGVPLKRTPKLLAGLGHCRFVVDVEWLYQSAKEGTLLDGVEFVLCDAEVRVDFCGRFKLCFVANDDSLCAITYPCRILRLSVKRRRCACLRLFQVVVVTSRSV